MSTSTVRQTIVLPPPVPLPLPPAAPASLSPYGPYGQGPFVPAQLIPTDQGNSVSIVPLAACPMVIAPAPHGAAPAPSVNNFPNNNHLATCLADSNALNKALNSLNLKQTAANNHVITTGGGGQQMLVGGAMPQAPRGVAPGVPCAPDMVTYSNYVNGSILSVPKCHSTAYNKAGPGGDELVVSVYGFVKSFLG